ncbi:hypothetical protein SAMN05421819_1722 [Bryocella elongata]|uniref:Uncharacterized protein n=1 Tax=Bryocella elongata TaxID=863522 RepID=A0A1H5WSG3_9BACT|nr:hypothetical protein [Bryocella elongata]SEG02354.1 hypothetical protein SAMN05421819_1722 [Bryocella elongata]
MRSAKIHSALATGINKFEICRMTARGLHAMHRQGTRTEETIDRVLEMIGPGSMVRTPPMLPVGRLKAVIAR